MADTIANNNLEVTKVNGRNFRSSGDVENFYRFVHENDLRAEAKMVFEKICKTMNASLKKAKKAKARKKKIQ